MKDYSNEALLIQYTNARLISNTRGSSIRLFSNGFLFKRKLAAKEINDIIVAVEVNIRHRVIRLISAVDISQRGWKQSPVDIFLYLCVAHCEPGRT